MSTQDNANLPIRVESLVSHYGERQILSGMTFDVRQGEIFVIMGGSGSGKSTLFRHLLGLKKPTSGQVQVFGKDIARIKRRELFTLRREMGVAFQGGALLGSLSVADNVALPLRELTKLDEATIEIMVRMKLELMSLSHAEHLMPSELSGGMTKRAGLARAVIMDPKLLFFDEPSAGLDPVVSAELDNLILKLRDALGMTIVVVTHELESARKIADRISVLDNGVVAAIGTVAEVSASDNERVQDLLNRRPRQREHDSADYLERLTQ